MDVSTRIGLERLHVYPVVGGSVSPEAASAVLAELAHVGIRIENPERLSDSFASEVPALVRHVRRMRGERGTFTPLFSGFPEKLPEYDHAGVRFLLARLRLLDVEDPQDADVRAALDFSDIGWWPASSVPQDVEKVLEDRSWQEFLPKDSRTQWLPVRLVSPEELEGELSGYLLRSLYAPSSLREDVRSDVEWLLGHFGASQVELERVTFRETRVMLLRALWEGDQKAFESSGATPDDLLRLFASLTGGDVSLTEKVTFPRLSRRARRTVVNTLEASPRLAEVFRRRGLWLALARGLHLSEWRAPRTQAMFARLRTTRHDHTSLSSRFEALLSEDVLSAVELLSSEAPGLLLRSLRRIASFASTEVEQKGLVAALERTGATLPLRLLFAARSQVVDNGSTYPRVVFGKTGRAHHIRNTPGHLALPEVFRSDLLDALDRSIATIAAARGSWENERIHVAPELERVLVPDALRSTAQGLAQVERGTRLPLGEGKVVRLFVHWRESDARSDLDLSMVALDAEFNVVDHVSWTNLANGGMVHSGDLTSAPSGAEEFIDVDLAKAKALGRQRRWRYLVPTVMRYSGPTFDELAEANVGWMLRDEASSGHRTFDPAAVVNAFELTGTLRSAVPVLVDLVSDEVLYVDVYLPGGSYAMVERDGGSISDLVSAAASRRTLKASAADVIRQHLAARGGEEVSTVEEATVSFGLGEGFTYDLLQPEGFLSDLL